MEVKIYPCDAELEAVIKQQGWIETTDDRNKQKGKKEFRKSKNARTCMKFDYINFVVYENGVGINGLRGPYIAADDLKLLFWYLECKTADKDYISNGHFDLECVHSSVNHMTNWLNGCRKFNLSTRESKKFERLLGRLDAIKLN